MFSVTYSSEWVITIYNLGAVNNCFYKITLSMELFCNCPDQVSYISKKTFPWELT